MRANDARTAVVLGLAALAAGCEVGPDYKKPSVPTPPAYSEEGPWRQAEPKDALPKPDWWKRFNDPKLDALEGRAVKSSPTLGAAFARYSEALAQARITQGSLYPSLAVTSDDSRELYSANRQTPTPSTKFAYTTNSFDLDLALSYELDLFGKVRRAVESARAAAEAQGAEYQNVLLFLEAGVAQNYFTLRALLSQQALYARDVKLLQDALDLVQKLRKGGANSDLDLYQAQAELEGVEASALAVDRQIAAQRHALAVLVGENPEDFTLEAEPLVDGTFEVPVGLPSELLERRPDVAAAERSLAAANARVGVAKAAFFPSIGLTAFAGANSADLNSLLRWGSREWAAGPFLSLPVFQGGENLAGYREAQAAYTEAFENYRQQVLGAFQEVEDGLSDLRIVSNQADVLAKAVDASEAASKLSIIRYKAGLVSYIEVIDSQRTQLTNELALTQARADRFSATVLLVRALGGGW